MTETPSIITALDSGYQPAICFNRNYESKVRSSGRGVPLAIGLEREKGLVSRFETSVFPEPDEQTMTYVERMIKFLLWARGGWRIWFGGPSAIGDLIKKQYSATGTRSFDADLMTRIYQQPFVVCAVSVDAVPTETEYSAQLGGNLDGCRLGFDLGASDFKVTAVWDAKVVFSEECPWNPKKVADPMWHFEQIQNGLRRAAAYLPRVDAIGGSSAGVIVDNQVMVASLFRAVPAERFAEAQRIFTRLRAAWGVPLEVANDGDVTALAGAMSLKASGVLGLAMGSSQAAGYINPKGGMTGWLNELAFAPVDFNPTAPIDEWSGDRGVGALYFSQQSVNKLLPAAGISVTADLALPERLKEVQQLMAKGDTRATRIYECLGTYLGYSIPHYCSFYDFDHALILGRVTSGWGGEILLQKAREVMESNFPDIAERVKLTVPDEKSRRVGQAVAAASLPMIEKGVGR